MGWLSLFMVLSGQVGNDRIMSVRGPVPPDNFVPALVHEHILCDFIGAKEVSPSRYRKEEVISVMLPYLKELTARGFKGFVDCTPAYIGRDPLLLKELSERSGLVILTNTGYYGAAQDKFLPDHAFAETPEQLAARWIREWEEGIEGTDVRPGFIKIGVDPGPLSEMDRKLVHAAVITHRKTGLTIACHTGEEKAAQGVLNTVIESGLDPSALIIVHADSVNNKDAPIRWARAGAWVEFDAIGARPLEFHLDWIVTMKKEGLLHKLLLSHDAGWYWVGEKDGGKEKIRPYTFLSDYLIPQLRQSGCTQTELDQLLVHNPVSAFTIRVRERH
ncbi:MAG: phosphotriesterase [Armatimonadetes bacterium]|nr:phosphotriesterase [Armatimonadota bacterium]MDW8121687.1 phosphotriesterase [Armatimonadota bacterium]